MNFKTLNIHSPREYILIVTLNRPTLRNAINGEMMTELQQLWQYLATHTEKYRCIILTGAPPVFCAGADLKERHHISLAVWSAQRLVFEQAMLAMLACPQPVIAAVNGAAFGGGLELVLASDFAYAVNTATFSQSEVKIGIMPAALGTQHLPRACGIRRAKELCFTGEVFSAQKAYEWGMINTVCEPDNLMENVLATAQKIVENAPLAIIATKQSLNMSQDLDIQSGFAFEVAAYNKLLPTKDREEGIRAFNEKRKPIFNGT